MFRRLLHARDGLPKLMRGGAIVASPASRFLSLQWTVMNDKRPLFHIRSRLRLLSVIGVVTASAIACESDPTDPDLNPDFMVGEWMADSLVMTSVANPEVVADLTELGADFTLSVQPSGRYTAIVEGFGQASSEVGKLTVDGAYVVLMPESPPGPESRALWERVGDSVILEGESEFDFNLDGTNEAATLRQVLSPK